MDPKATPRPNANGTSQTPGSVMKPRNQRAMPAPSITSATGLFCLPGVNAFRPAFRFAEIVREVGEIARMPLEPAARSLQNSGIETARRHSLNAERDRSGQLLSNLYALWTRT